MAQISTWWGAGVLTAGLSAAVLTGAGAAGADTDAASDAGTATSAGDSGSDTASSADSEHRAEKAEPATDRKTERRKERVERRESRAAEKAAAGKQKSDTTEDPGDQPDRDLDPAAEPAPDSGADATRPKAALVTEGNVDVDADVDIVAAADDEVADPPPATIPVVGDVLGPFQPDYPPLIRAVGSALFNLIGAVVQAADGPPLVPSELRDSVRVSSSGLVVAPGTELDADWYIPTSSEQPQRLIYLQHGILASGPMYSHTASYLAQRTNSVVVVTTITSNPFADGGMWLGGDNLHQAVAGLFLDDNRAALNASLATAALKVGAPVLTVPEDFVLVGHSLGGGFAPGVGGHYAAGLVARRSDAQDDGDTDNHLAGVITLDGVPFSPILPNALDRMAALHESNGGDPDDYIPVYEIGAPFNFLNAFSSIQDELTEARPGKFNGVVINGGVHMDGMLGGNPLIQAAAYLVAGIPQPQNPPAVQLLMAGWINDMFAGSIDPESGRCLGAECDGSYGAPGTTIVIPSDTGTASAVVIGPQARPVTDRFRPLEVSSLVRPGVRRPSVAVTV